jgi:hypothetical protein
LFDGIDVVAAVVTISVVGAKKNWSSEIQPPLLKFPASSFVRVHFKRSDKTPIGSTIAIFSLEI